MAYLEIRKMLDSNNEIEYDACAYTDDEAASEFDDEIAERLARQDEPWDEPHLRYIDWTDDQVADFNQLLRTAYDIMMTAINQAEGGPTP